MAISSTFQLVRAQILEHPVQSLVIAFVILAISYLVNNEFVRSNARLSGIKGPPGLPLIGNIYDIRVNAAERYRTWAKTYGDVYQIQLGNIPVVVVNTAAAARTIFGQNAQAMSSRPEFYTFHKVHVSQPRLLGFVLIWSGLVEHCWNDDRYFSV